MSKLADMQSKFLKEVTAAHIKVSWDAGWCYSYIEHPILDEAEEALSHEKVLHDNGASWSELDTFNEWTDVWLSENEPMLYHMSDVVDGMLVNQLGTWDEEMEKFEQITAKEYAKGLIALIQRDPTGYKDEEKIAELQAFINS